MDEQKEQNDGERTPEDETIRGRIVSEVAVPDFTAEWRQIREDLESAAGLLRDHAAVALRIGQTLVKIHDVLPRGLWLAALKEHGMSQPQASRYIRFANMSEADRAVFQRARFSLTEAIGEGKRRKGAAREGDHSNDTADAEIEIPADEMCDRLAEVERRLKLAFRMVDLGEARLAEEGEGEPSEEDDERWRSRVAEIAEDVRTAIAESLEAVMTRRLVPGRS